MTPQELKEIKERDRRIDPLLQLPVAGANLQAERDRRALLEYVDVLAREKVIAAARALAEIDQLRAQMEHALKELRE